MKYRPIRSAVDVVESALDLGERLRGLSQYAEALPRESQQHLHQKLHSLAVWIDQVLEADK